MARSICVLYRMDSSRLVPASRTTLIAIARAGQPGAWRDPGRPRPGQDQHRPAGASGGKPRVHGGRHRSPAIRDRSGHLHDDQAPRLSGDGPGDLQPAASVRHVQSAKPVASGAGVPAGKPGDLARNFVVGRLSDSAKDANGPRQSRHQRQRAPVRLVVGSIRHRHGPSRGVVAGERSRGRSLAEFLSHRRRICSLATSSWPREKRRRMRFANYCRCKLKMHA